MVQSDFDYASRLCQAADPANTGRGPFLSVCSDCGRLFCLMFWCTQLGLLFCFEIDLGGRPPKQQGRFLSDSLIRLQIFISATGLAFVARTTFPFCTAFDIGGSFINKWDVSNIRAGLGGTTAKRKQTSF